MRVLICGSRTFTDADPIERVIDSYAKDDPDTVIIEGGARGADCIAGNRANWWGLTHEQYPANWQRHSYGAGPIRNKQMLEEGKPDVVWAFIDKALESSKGTLNMVRQAKDAGLPVYVVERIN